MGLDTREFGTLGEKHPPWQANPADDGQPMETVWPMIDDRVWDRLVRLAVTLLPPSFSTMRLPLDPTREPPSSSMPRFADLKGVASPRAA